MPSPTKGILDYITEGTAVRPSQPVTKPEDEQPNHNERLTSGEVLRTFISLGSLLIQARQQYDQLAEAPKAKYAEGLADLIEKAKQIQTVAEKLQRANK